MPGWKFRNNGLLFISDKHFKNYSHVAKLLLQAIQNNGDLLFETQGKRENDVTIKAKNDAKINLCWQKLDRKTKKLTFNFKVTNVDSNVKANTETLQLL